MKMTNQLTGNDLREWVSSNDLLFQITPAQSEVIISTLEKNDYSIIIKDEKLYSVYSKANENIESPITIDDVVDLAAELNYEELNAVQLEMELGPSDIKEYCGRLHKLINLQYESMVLDTAFENTIYAKKINEVVFQNKNMGITDKNKNKHVR